MAAGQTLMIFKQMQTTSNFSTVKDSILKLTNPNNTFIIKTCDEYREFYVTKNNIGWTCYFLKNLKKFGLIEPRFEIDKNGNARQIEPFLTSIITFDADSLTRNLYKMNFDKVVQMTDSTIEIDYNKRIQKKDKNIMHSLPYSSHDCYMSITTINPNPFFVQYRTALLEDSDFHFIPSLKIFYDVRTYLIAQLGNYYH
jgi:hypothetical protein